MLTEIMWVNLFRIVQFGVRYGVLVLTFWMLEPGIRWEIPPYKPADHVVVPVAVTGEMTVIRNLSGESGEGVDMVDRNGNLISFSDRQPDK